MLHDFIVFANADLPEHVHERLVKWSEDHRQAVPDLFEMQRHSRNHLVKEPGSELDRAQALRTDEESCREAAKNLAHWQLSAEKIGSPASQPIGISGFLKDLTGLGKWVPGAVTIDCPAFMHDDNRNARKQRDAPTQQEGRKARCPALY